MARDAAAPAPGTIESFERDGTLVTVRRIAASDAALGTKFLGDISSKSLRFRFFDSVVEFPPEVVSRFTQVDFTRDMALVATCRDPDGERGIGVCRYFKLPSRNVCEFAMVIADAWQRKGIGSRMMARLIEAARAQGLDEMQGDILLDNRGMIAMCRRLGFSVGPSGDDRTVVSAVLKLH